MLISLLLANTLLFFKLTLCNILGYIVSVTIAGAFAAWIAKKCGDMTADYAGFLTLDPLVHVDPIGAIMFVLFSFGWGREIPIDIYAIKSPLRDLKILITYYSRMIMHLVLLVIGSISFALIKLYLVSTGNPSVIIPLVFQTFVGLNSGLCLLRFIQASVDLIFIPLKVDDEQTIRIISLLLTLMILFFLGTRIQMFFYNLSVAIAFALVSLVS